MKLLQISATQRIQDGAKIVTDNLLNAEKGGVKDEMWILNTMTRVTVRLYHCYSALIGSCKNPAADKIKIMTERFWSQEK